MKTFLAFVILAGIGADLLGSRYATAQEAERVSLKELPDFNPATSYKVDPYIVAAARLQAAGKEKAGQLLLDLAKDRDHGEKVIVLCRMLFTPKPGGEFRRPLLGGAVFLGQTEYADWPLEPIEVVDGVPFLVIRGYRLRGQAERPESYVAYCVGNCDWQALAIKARTGAEKQMALEKLVASPKWKAGLTDEEKQFLTSQIK